MTDDGSAPTSASAPTSVTPRRRWPTAVRRARRRCPARASAACRGCTPRDPVGVTDQPEFRNAVVALDVPAGPDAGDRRARRCSPALKDLERAFGRRPRRRWGPRELDLDLLVFGRARLAVERPPEARSLDADVRPGEGREAARRARTRPPRRGCSSSRRWPTSRPGSCRRAGARRSRPRGAARLARRRARRGPRRSARGTPAATWRWRRASAEVARSAARVSIASPSGPRSTR